MVGAMLIAHKKEDEEQLLKQKSWGQVSGLLVLKLEFNDRPLAYVIK